MLNLSLKAKATKENLFRSIVCIFICITAMFFFLIILGNLSQVLAWNAITHHTVNERLLSNEQTTFSFSGTAPDMSIQIIGDYPKIPDEGNYNQSEFWADYFHSPDLKIEDGTRLFLEKPNFAYLLLKASERNGYISDVEKAQVLGWGSHIAADWVAHNDNLFPVCPNGSLGSIKHLYGETLYELYSFLSDNNRYFLDSNRENVFIIDDSTIYKALFNYRMISIYENQLSKNKSIDISWLKKTTKDTTVSIDEVQDRVKKWAAKVFAIGFGYAKGMDIWNLAQIAGFMQYMQDKGADVNIALAEESARNWVQNPTARGSIPDYRSKTIPFFRQNLLSISNVNLPNESSQNLYSACSSLIKRKACQIDTLTAENNSKDLWEIITEKALENGSIKVDQARNDEGLLETKVSLQDDELLNNTINDTIFNCMNSDSASQNQEVEALLWKKLLIDGVLDPNILNDYSRPNIEIIQPVDGSYVNNANCQIKAVLNDDTEGSGIDNASIVALIDGEPASVVYTSEIVDIRGSKVLNEGLHSAYLSVADKAGNRASKIWYFTIDTVAPKLCYTIKNSVISSYKPCAQILVSPDEFASFSLTVLKTTSLNLVYGPRDCGNSSGEPLLIQWNGTDNSGNKVAIGQYIMRITAMDKAGNIKIMDRYVSVK